MKKIFASIAAGLLALASFLPVIGVVRADESSSKQKLDMYLIAGQSNAAGYSHVPSNTETFENVAYAGETDKTLCGSNTTSAKSDFLSSFDKYRWSVTAGLGATGAHIGPEYGMAKVLNERYATGDTKAFIFKTAAGGTYLLDKGGSLSTSYGNWYPRSLWPSGYTPNVDSASTNNDPTGILYQLFVKNFEKVYNTLVEHNYEPVVKGMIWMQGENDLPGIDDKYGDTLKAFITDIRTDLVSITGDGSLQAMPFVIGKIAESFQGWWNQPAGPAQMAEMHRQQERMVTELEAVSTISTDDLIIVGKDGTTMGSDVSHYSGKDAVILGERFANAVLDLNGATRIACNSINGMLSYAFIDQERSKVKFVLENISASGVKFKFVSLKINGQDVTEQVVNGEYILENASGLVLAEAVFEEEEKYQITYTEVDKKAGFQYTPKYVYKGELLSLNVLAKKGYTIEKVTFNGQEMTFNEETGEYEISVHEAGEVQIFISAESDVSGDDNSSKDSGCSGSISGTIMVGSLCVLACGVLVAKKRK